MDRDNSCEENTIDWCKEMEYKFLIEEAKKHLRYSYAPYSNIHVAATILTDQGSIYYGVNVENSSYGLTICAERSAVASMVSNGERKPIAIAIVTDLEHPIPPCGACRQVLAEFNPEITIVMHSVKSGETSVVKLSDIFKNPFLLRSTEKIRGF